MWGTAITIVLFSFAPFVLTKDAKPAKNYTICLNSTEVAKKSNATNTCFKNIVNKHLDSSYAGECTIPKLEEDINAHRNALNATCGLNFLRLNATNLMKYIELSLSNQTFKEFYGDVNCVKTLEKNITACVKDKVGYTTISKERKHSGWYKKMDLAYAQRNCDNSNRVKECVLNVLSTCKPSTSKYVSSLFDYAHSKCSNLTNVESQDPIVSPPSSHQTIIIVSSLLGVVILSIVGVLIWLKIKK